VRAPRVNDKRVDEDTGERKRFSSAILPAWARKSPQVAEVLPLLYLHGCPAATSGRRWSSSSARVPGLSPRRSPG
jgi:putative transposase